MVIEYKGHKAKLSYRVDSYSMLGPDYGSIILNSTICSYKLRDIAIGSDEHRCIGEVFIKWFKTKVDNN